VVQKFPPGACSEWSEPNAACRRVRPSRNGREVTRPREQEGTCSAGVVVAETNETYPE